MVVRQRVDPRPTEGGQRKLDQNTHSVRGEHPSVHQVSPLSVDLKRIKLAGLSGELLEPPACKVGHIHIPCEEMEETKPSHHSNSGSE